MAVAMAVLGASFYVGKIHQFYFNLIFINHNRGNRNVSFPF